MLLNPLMLAWISGAALPLVLHFLSRSRYQTVPWGAMMFLTGVNAPSKYAALAKQIALLLVRMVALGILAVALARPVIASHYTFVPTAGLTTGGPIGVVIIVDDSPSMGYTKNGKLRLDQAREVTLQILSSLKRGDQAALFLAGSRENQSQIALSPDLQSIAGRITDARPDVEQADFAHELNRAVGLVEHSSFSESDIYVICDTQALSWRNLIGSDKIKFARPVPRITVILVGDNETDNIAIEAIEIPDQPIIRNEVATVNVRVHNYGSASQPSIPLSVWTGTRTIGTVAIDVPARSTQSVNMPIRFSEQGSHVISAAITSTGLTTDDRLDLAIDVVEQLQVLVVNGPSENSASRPTTLPTTQLVYRGRNAEFASVKTVSFSEWSKDDLNKVNVAMFYDVPEFSFEQQSMLRKFASLGGGILIVLGNHVNADNYNKTLYNNGHGILSTQLQTIGKKLVRIGTVNRQHPIFHLFPNRLSREINPFFLVSPVNASHVLARLTSGDPWLIESPIDRGRVLLMTGMVDLDMQMPLLQSIIRYLGVGQTFDRNIRPGEPIVLISDQPVEPRSVTVQFAGSGPREPATVIPTADHTEIRYTKTNRPGPYRLRYASAGKIKLVNYVVAAQRYESDLTILTDDQWKTLRTRVGFHRLDLSKTTVGDAMNIQRGGREIWIDLLAAVLLLMIAEIFLSQRWSK